MHALILTCMYTMRLHSSGHREAPRFVCSEWKPGVETSFTASQGTHPEIPGSEPMYFSENPFIGYIMQAGGSCASVDSRRIIGRILGRKKDAWLQEPFVSLSA